MKTWFSLSIVTVVALLTLWLQDIFKETPLVPKPEAKHFADYFLDNFSVTQLNEQGQTSYRLSAKKLQHYGDDNSSELSAPRLEFHDARGNWTISAQRALVQGDTEIIQLYEQVEIRHLSTAQQDALAIDTAYLKVDTRTKIARTDQAARIYSSTVEYRSQGMVFDSARDILKLTSQVTGTHAALK